MRGQSSRAFEQQGAFFRPIMEDDDDTCSSSSPSAGSSPVSFWPSSTTTRCMQSEEDKVLALYDQAAKDRERMKLIKELILSEQDYVKDLEAINSLFLQPLRKRRIVPEADVGLLFSTLPAISSLNKALLGVVAKRFADAEERNRSVDAMVSSYVQSKSSSAGAGNPFRTARGLATLANCKREECLIADAFEQMASYLKVYTIYATRYVDAMAVIRRHKAANPAFYEFLEEVKGAPECRGRDMKTLMLRPVERLCQYITILDDLVRVTPHTHGDYALLAQTAAKVKESASAAEESLMSNQLAAREDDTIAPAAAAEETRNGSGVRRRKVSVVEDARLERRRDSLAHLPGLVETSVTATAVAESSNKDVGASRQLKSWRRSLARFTTLSSSHTSQQRSFSVGDGSAMAGGESLLALLEREKQAGGSSVAGAPRSLKRGGSLTNTTSAGGAPKRVQPRRTNSAAALCRYESATGATFKGNLVC